MKAFHGAFDNQVFERDFVEEAIIKGAPRGVLGKSKAAGGIGLRVAIDDERPHVVRRQRRAQIDGGGGLPHAALLVCDRDDSAHLHQSLGNIANLTEGDAAGKWKEYVR